MIYTIYEPATGRLLSETSKKPAVLHVEGSYSTNDFYVEMGQVKPRIPVKLTLDKYSATIGEIVTVTGVPDDGMLLHKNQVTSNRSFVMTRQNLRLGLVGKYFGYVQCNSVTLDKLKDEALKELMLSEIRASPAGKSVLSAKDANSIRSVKR